MKYDISAVDLAIRELIVEMTDIDRPLNTDDLLIDDLALSSIDMVEISTALRKRFEVDVSPQALSSCICLGDLIGICTTLERRSRPVA